jgi:hypothetical protein
MNALSSNIDDLEAAGGHVRMLMPTAYNVYNDMYFDARAN